MTDAEQTSLVLTSIKTVKNEGILTRHSTSKTAVLKQFLAASSAALSLFICGCWVGWPSPVIRKIKDGDVHFNITTNDISWIVACMEVGNFLSPIPSGSLADCLGRKMTLLIIAFVFVGTGLLAVFGTSAWYLFAARIGAGIGKGMAYTVASIYLGEIASVQVRGALSTMLTGLVYLGVLFVDFVGPLVTYTELNVISLILPVVFFLTFVWFPDSPYFLLMKGRKRQARKALAWFRHTTETDVCLKKELDEMTKSVQREMERKGSFKELVSTPGNRKALTIVLFLSAAQRLGGISPMVAYTVVTLPKTGGYFKPEVYMILFAVSMLVGNYTATPLMDRLGRKPLLILSCTCCALCTGISSVFYWLAGPEKDTHYNWVPYACFILYGITFGVGFGTIPTTFVTELFPTNIKSLASALSVITLAGSSFFIHKFYLVIQESYGAHYMLGVFAISNFSAVIFAVFFVFETKGKSFLQIQERLNNK